MFYEKYRLNPSLFEDIKKNSHKRPYLFYVYSKFCYACIVLEPVMREVVRDLEPLGIF
jgi:DnaJ family protein C protein 16